MNAKGCTTVAARLMWFLAEKLGLDLSGRVTISRERLALMMALAGKEGWERGFAAGKGEQGQAHGKLWALEAPGVDVMMAGIERAA